MSDSPESEFGVPFAGTVLPPEQWTQTALKKLPAGVRIVSHDFDMRGVKPDKVIKVEPEGDRQHTVYLWTTPLKFVKED